MDAITIQKILTGNKQAFKGFYDEYAKKALGVAIGIMQNRDLAKDAVQETFIRVYRNLHSYDTDKPFEPWFYRILTNECNRILKRESKVIFVDRVKLENNDRLSESKNETVEDLNEAIQLLEENYRKPLVLKYLEGFSEKEIAEILELNQNTVKTRLYKGREKLKETFGYLEKRRSNHG